MNAIIFLKDSLEGSKSEYTIRKRSSKNAEHSVSRRYYLILIVVLSMPGGFHDV